MLNHTRSRNRAAAVFAVSLIAFVAALLVPKSEADLTFRTFLLVCTLAVMLTSAIWLLIRWDEAKRRSRLSAGKGVIARWTIDPARWEWFRGHSDEWDKREGVRPNDADLKQTPGPTGIEIVVTNDGILIGDDFRPLEKDAAITVYADWMEFDQIIPRRRGPAWHMILRLPLSPGSEHLASEVQRTYRSAYVAAASSPRFKIYAALIIFVGLPAVTGLIWLIANATGWAR